MTLNRLLMTSGLSALAAALAMTSLPVAAAAAVQPDHAEERDNRGSVGRQTRSDRREVRNEARSEARSNNRAETRREPSPDQRVQRAPQTQMREQQRTADREVPRNVERDRRGDNANRGDRGDRGERPAIVSRPPNNRGGEAVLRQREQDRSGELDRRGQGDSSERNRSYTNRDRNGSYADRNRDSAHGQRNDYRGDRRDGYRGDRHDARHDRNDYRNHRDWNRHDWRKNKRYNWYGYRDSHRSTYRLGHYYAPYRNYRYSRLNIGIHLGSVFFSSRYWINDPWQYRLPEVYGPYRWVRYYDDVLLVDIYSGEVVDVIYDFFW